MKVWFAQHLVKDRLMPAVLAVGMGWAIVAVKKIDKGLLRLQHFFSLSTCNFTF